MTTHIMTTRVPTETYDAFAQAAGGKRKVAERVRALMAQYVKKRAGERAKAPVKESPHE